jgi:hypothetical protein
MPVTYIPMLSADQIWSIATRRLREPNVEDDTYASITAITSSATADAFGAWTQLMANVGTQKILKGVVVTFAGSAYKALIEIGIGASGSETAIARIPFNRPAGATAAGVLYVPIDKELPDNARLSARVKDSNAAADTYYVAPIIVSR